MNIDQFMKDHPELYAEIVKNATDQATASFTKEKTALTGTIDSLTVKLTESEKRITELAKKDEIRSEREMASDAEVVWVTKLTASDIPERMFSKVKKNVDYNAFVKDGVLDKAAFAAAIDTELKDWEDFKSSSDNQVQGFGFSAKDVEKQTALDAENAKLADAMFAMTGIK